VSQHVPAALREQVLSQAGGLCAYCRSAESLLGVTFEIDHIVPLSAGGGTTADNLCLSCPTCNRQKGFRQTAPDPASGEETPLFHPLAQTWDDHFTWSEDGATVIGLTPVGRATIALLRVNRPILVQMRRYWFALGLPPPR
jgi:5-methylcytosine-specific restriction endonuclease McrA